MREFQKANVYLPTCLTLLDHTEPIEVIVMSKPVSNFENSVLISTVYSKETLRHQLWKTLRVILHSQVNDRHFSILILPSSTALKNKHSS